MCYFQVQKLSETIGEKEKESGRADYHTEHRTPNGTLILKHTSPPTCKLELGDGEYIGAFTPFKSSLFDQETASQLNSEP